MQLQLLFYDYLRFPTDPELKAKWTAAVRRKNWTPTPSSSLCSEHFDANQFQRPPGLKLPARLKREAVPTNFPSHPPHLQPVS